LLTVKNARLVIHQVGKKSFTLTTDELLVQLGDEIRVQAIIADLLGGNVELRSTLNAKTLAGETRLKVADVQLDSKRLAALPLAPSVLQEEHFSTTCSLAVQMIHPANDLDLRQHSLVLAAQIQDVASATVGPLCSDLDFTVENRNGVVQLRGRGDPLQGRFELNVGADLFAEPIIVETTARIEEVNLHPLLRFVERTMQPRESPLPPVHAVGALYLASRVALETDTVKFACRLRTGGSQLNVDNLALGDLTAEVDVQGAYAPSAEQPLSGVVTGSYAWDGLSLTAAAKRYQLGEAAGRVASSGQFEIALDRLTDPAAHRCQAAVQAQGVAFRGVALEEGLVRLQLEQGVAEVHAPETQILDTTLQQIAQVTATLRADLRDAGLLTARWNASDIAVKSLIRLAGTPDDLWAGDLSAKGSASVPLREVMNPNAWAGGAQLVAQGLVLHAEPISDVVVQGDLREGELTIPESQIRWRNAVCKLSATGSIDTNWVLQGQVAGTKILLSDVSDLASRFSKSPIPAKGSVETDGQFQVSGFPITFTAQGQAKLHEASYAGARIGEADFQWSANSSGVQLKSSSDRFFNGTYLVTVDIEGLDWTQATVKGSCQNIQVASLLAAAKVDLPSTGVLDGEFQLGSIQELTSLQGQANVRTRGVTIKNVSVELANGELAIGDGRAQLRCQGNLSEGTFEAIADCELLKLTDFLGDPQPIHQIPIYGSAKLERLLVDRLAAALKLAPLAPLRASVDVACTRNATTIEAGQLCNVTASLDNVTWNNARLSDRLTADIALSPTLLNLQQVRGRFADGQISGYANIALGGQPSGVFKFGAANVNLRRVSAAVQRSGSAASGNASLVVSGRIGAVITGQSYLSVENAKLGDLAVRQVRLPVDWSFNPQAQMARWRCRAGTVELGNGTVHLASDGSYYRGLTTSTTLRIENVDTSRLTSDKSTGAGVIDGTVSINAKRALTPQQFSGAFDLELSQAKALELPVLDKLPQMVSIPALPGTHQPQEDGGYLVGRMAGGVIYIDALGLAQSNVQVFMEGTATFAGRLNMDVTVSTAQSGPIDDLLSLANSPIMLAAAAPVALVAKANDAIKSRVIYVQVSGTANRPVLRIQPLKQLTQDALRFFISSTVGSDVAGVASNLNSPK